MTAEFVELDQQILFWTRKYADLSLRMVALHGLVDGACTCPKGRDCRSAGKHPVAKNWPKSATSDYEKIATQLEGARNLGIATGAGIVVLDVDGAEGRESLRQLAAENGDLPMGPIAETGSGGLHLFFRSAEAFGNSVKFLPGLDVRGEGGQVVACPSLHKSGRRYAWLEVDGQPSIELPLPEMPPWLAEILRGERRVEWDANAWLATQDPSIEGENGSAQLMRVLGALTRNGVRNLESAMRTIAPWNARCVPPWSETELERAFENAMKRVLESAVIQLPTDKKGQVICTRASLDRIVREDPKYEFAFSMDERTMDIHFEGRPIRDKDFIDAEVEICRRYCLRNLDKASLRESILSRAQERSFNPVKDYLRSLEWDGVERLALVPTTLLGAAPSPIASTYFKRWAVGAVRRALEPGCQMDTVLILYGLQGIYKSGFFRALGEPWFNDPHFDLENKDTLMSIQKNWITEWSELTSISRFETERIKAFLSVRTDQYRLPYGRSVVEVPRAGVIVGTTNREEFLSDPTGNRRFWVIACGPDDLDLARVREQRDQLWAEAVMLAAAGEPHWLSQSERLAHADAIRTYESDDAIYWAARGEVEIGPDSIVWPVLCARIGLNAECSGKQRDSIARALRECNFAPGFVTMDGKKKRAWIRTRKTLAE